MAKGKSVDHYRELIRMITARQHDDFEVELVLADVLYTGLEIQKKHLLRFWRWGPYFYLADRIYKVHAKCCKITKD